MSNYKRLFIKNYNYIFFTIVTYNRNQILLDNIQLLKESFKYALSKYKFKIIAIAVLQDHIHTILKINDINQYPKIIYSIKYYFSVHMNKNFNISESKQKKGEKGIWQRRYWEHTIRDEEDLRRHIDYIHYNPIKHNIVKSLQNYQYTSFKKFVELKYYDINWCNQNDVNKIDNLDFE